MKEIQLQAETREILGKKVKTLRAKDFLPGVVYGRGFTPISIQVPMKDFEKVYAEAGESTLVYIKMKNESYPTIIHDVALDPISEKFMHVDFYKVRLDEKIKAKITLNFIGEAPAIKGLGGILVKNMSEIEVEGLPQDLPHKIDVNIAGLEQFNSQILVKNLAISDKVIVLAKPEEIIALIQEPITEEELKAQLETPTVAPEDVEVIKKEKPEKEGTEEPGEKPVAAPAPEKK